MSDLNQQVEITLNSEPRRIASGQNIDTLLESLGLERDLVAVELNGELIRKARFGELELGAGDRIEIVEFVGGG